MEKLKSVSFRNIDITGGFLAQKQKLNADTTIYAVRDRFKDTGRFEAFKFNWTEGSDIPKPHFFWDSDIAKWMESAAYILEKKEDASLRAEIEEVIDLIEEHQDPSGYFNIFHTVAERGNRFRFRDNHELYCLGHLIEAAVAIHDCLGSDRLIDILDRYVDCVIRMFCEEKITAFKTPGHEEIELALFRLYAIRPEKKYLDLAMYFLNERNNENVPLAHWAKHAYNQSHLPVREQRDALGHCVRACYLYSGMTDAAVLTDDAEMLTACKALFDDIYYKKMYITGGIGSTRYGEAFTIPFDLSNDRAYTETCAGIALAMFANRMKDVDTDSKYADCIERLIFNGILSGLSLDGKGFFYENPLEVNLAERKRYTGTNDGCDLPPNRRSEVFGCSCCPPNITRFIASVGDYMISHSDSTVYLHQFADMNAKFDGIELTVKTNYPCDGKINISVCGAKGRKLAVRKPWWCENYTCTGDKKADGNGYIYFDISSDKEEISVDFEILPVFVAASPNVRHDACKTALTYGPVVYCAERIDNDYNLWNVLPDTDSAPVKENCDKCGLPVFTAKAKVVTSTAKDLYVKHSLISYKEADIKFIPYYAFSNREECDMAVWFNARL